LRIFSSPKEKEKEKKPSSGSEYCDIYLELGIKREECLPPWHKWKPPVEEYQMPIVTNRMNWPKSYNDDDEI
jgi:hypothetical protein